MKKTIIYFLFIILWYSTTYSQIPQINVTWGLEQKGSAGNNDKEQSYNIGKDLSGGFYSLREKYKYLYGQVSGVKRFIDHFNSDGKLIGSEKIIIEKENSKRFFDGIFYNEGRMYLVTNYFRASDKMNVLSVQSINPNTLLVEDDIRGIAEIPYKIELLYWFKHYTIKVVNDKIYALHLGPVKESEQVILGIHVFDKDFKLQWKHYQTLDYKEDLFLLEDYDVDHEGTIRVMATVYKDKKRKTREGKPNYDYHFFVFSNKGIDFKEHSLTLSNKFITDMRFSYRANGDIVCTGFYSNESSWLWSNTIAGAFFVTIDPETTHIKMENFMAFSQEFLTSFMSADAAEKGKELKNFDLKNFHFLENGGAILLAEEITESQTNIAITTSYTSTNRTEYATNYTTTTTTNNINWTNFQFDNIIIIKINQGGIIEWAKIIPKKQHTTADGGIFSSFATAYIGDKIYLIYNDNPKNLTSINGKIYGFKKSKEAIVVCTEIDFDGNINKKALFSAGEAEILTCPGSCRQTSINSMSIYGKKGKSFKWGILEFQ